MHPEGIAVSADGTLYVGGFISGNVVRIDPCTHEVEEWQSPGILGNIAGLLVDDADERLWVCASDFGQRPPNPRLTALSLDDGTVVGSHIFPSGSGICNDLTFDDAGNLYATDSFAHRIVRVDAASLDLEGDQTDTVEVWSADPTFGQIMPGTFGLNGIAWATDGLYVAAFHGSISEADPKVLDPSHLYRIPIEEDGSAGPAEILGDVPFGDGLEWLGDATFLVNERSSALSRLELDAGGLTLTPLREGLDFSTTAAVVGDVAWVVEGQLDHFLDPKLGPATDPFVVTAVPIDR